MMVASDNQYFVSNSFPADIRLQQKLVQLSKYLVAIVICIGILTLVGWEFDIGFLKRPLPRLIAMNPLTATCFVLTGISFFILSTSSKRLILVLTGYLLLLIVVFAGLLRLSDVIIQTDIGLDLILYKERLGTDAQGNITSRMAPITAFNFMFTGISVLLMKISRQRNSAPGHIISILVGFMAILAILGYVYRVQAFHGILTYIPMAIHTAICFLALSAAMLFANPGKGIMREFTTRYAGSIIARRLVPVAILVPAILGLLRLYGHWAGLFTTEFGVAILVLSIMVIFLLFIWYTVTLLNRRDRLKATSDTELQKMQQRVDALFDTAPDATIIVNERGMIDLVNRQTEKLFGYTREELIGRPIEILIPPELRSKHIGHVRNFAREPRARSMGAGMELQAVKKNGERFPVEISLSPLQTGEGLQVSASIRDITDRKKQEQKFRSLLDSAPDATIIVNEKGFIEMINLQAEKIFGYKREELIGQSVEILIPGELHKMHTQHVANYIREPRVRSMGAGMELQAVKKDGKRFPVEISLSPLQMEEGMLVSAAIRDITERKQAEEKLRRFNEDLELLVQERTLKIARDQEEILRMNEQLRKLSAHLQEIREEERIHIAREIHDELGQQLTAIKMDIATINKRLNIDDKEIKTRTESVLKMLDVAVQTVRRIASELRPGVLDDLGLITAIEWQSQEFGNRSGIQINSICDVPEMEFDKSTSIALFRIFQESLTNVSRHARATEVNVELHLENEQLVLHITDNGTGFDPSTIQHKRTLGLLGMKERARIIGGSYEITSKPGEGTKVQVSVPIQGKPGLS